MKKYLPIIIIQLIFITLKLKGVTELSWLVTLIPFIMVTSVQLFVLLLKDKVLKDE